MEKAPAKNIDEYIAAFPKSTQALLQQMRATISKAAPEAEETINYAKEIDPHTIQVSLAAPYPGKIIAVDLKQLGGRLICQKDAFLCAARGVQLGIAFQQKLSVGFFGGEVVCLVAIGGEISQTLGCIKP